MSIATSAARRPSDRARRDALRPLVEEATTALVDGGPSASKASASALAQARAAAEAGDGCDGRASAAVRTAWAYLASGQTEDAFFALESARDALIRT
jgi:hypothetical protein